MVPRRHHTGAIAVFACVTVGAGFAVLTAEDGEPPPAVDVQFQDDFSQVTGATMTQIDGGREMVQGELRGHLSCYASLPPDASGHLKLVITEDDETEGPDGQPGVLRLQVAELPSHAHYSGFLVYGNESSGDITMPGWKRGEVTRSDLQRAFVTFRFRAASQQNPSDYGAIFNFRLEPDDEESYRHRADFGALIATTRWRWLRRPLGSAENLQEFLHAINTDPPARFKLVWGQRGTIYTEHGHPGDGLLIDDLKITIE